MLTGQVPASYHLVVGNARRRVPNLWESGRGGARIKGRARIAEWDGFAELSAGRIVAAEPWAMDSPAETVTLESDRRVSWRSCTAGDQDGVILTVEGAQDAKIEFHSPIIETSVRVAEAMTKPVRIAGGGLDLHATLEALPLSSESGLMVLQHVDESPLERTAPYWVRVVQSDGARAWSSPIYVNPSAHCPSR